MAWPTSRSSGHQGLGFHSLGVLVLLILVQTSGAREFKVGGANGWAVPTDPNAMTLNQWAEKNRFQIGDSLLFVYQPDKDSVLQVTKDNYNNCETSSYIVSFSDGKSLLKLNQSGPHYFISGFNDNCRKNEKLVVVVMADRSGRSSNTNQTSLAPSPTSSGSSGTAPSIAPTGEVSPSPPSNSPSPPSGAPPNMAGLLGSIGILIGSSLLFVL